MCPLVSAPNRGYADYQRTSNYDTQPLFNQVVGPQNTQFTSGVLDVSRHAYLGGRITPNGGDFSAQVTWFADGAGSVVLNWRTFQITPNIPGNATLHLPNLGPFAQLQLSSIAGVNYTATIVLIGTNRIHPLEFIPRNPVILDVASVAVATGVAADVYPTDYYAGPVELEYITGGSAFNYDIQYLKTDGTWSSIHHDVVAANSTVNTTHVVPPGAWRVEMTQSSGAGQNAGVRATPTTTGAT